MYPAKCPNKSILINYRCEIFLAALFFSLAEIRFLFLQESFRNFLFYFDFFSLGPRTCYLEHFFFLCMSADAHCVHPNPF